MHRLSGGRGIKAAREGHRLNPNLGGQLNHHIVVALGHPAPLHPVRCEERLVHGPEFALVGSAAAGHGSDHGRGVDLGERKVAGHDPHDPGIHKLRDQPGANLVEELDTEGALEVGEFVDRHRRGRAAQRTRVVFGNVQYIHLARDG